MSGSRQGFLSVQRKKNNEGGQTICLYQTGGHLWMRGYYDRLPSSVRRRLQASPHNLCAWCLTIKVLPKVRARYRGCSYEEALLIAVSVMEKMAEQQDKALVS
jgi:hypothetical protein